MKKKAHISVLMVLMIVFLGMPAVANQEPLEDVRGVVAGLSGGSLTLPPSSPVAVTLTLSFDRGAVIVPLTVVFVPQTDVRLSNPILRNGDMIEVDLEFAPGRFEVSDVKEASIAKFNGTASNVPGGSLVLPVSSNTSFTLQIAGLGGFPIVLTPSTRVDDSLSLRNGDEIKVYVVVQDGNFIATKIDFV